MKKFKSRTEKETQQSREMAQLLAEKNLLKSVFLDYIKLPIGTLLLAVILIASILGGRYLFSIENALLMMLSLSLFSGLSSLRAWAKFQEVPVDLRYKTSRYIANRIWPISLLCLFVYLLLPLGISVILTGLILLYLTIFYSLKLPGTEFSFHQTPLMKATTLAGIFSGLCLISLLAPGGQVTLGGGIFMASIFIITFIVSVKSKLLLD